MSLTSKILLAVGLEIIYAISTRIWLKEYFGGIELELYVSGVRLFTAAIYWFLFRDIILSRSVVQNSSSKSIPLFGVGLIIIAPILTGNWGISGSQAQIVFAITSLAVGVREEILYRGVLQNLLEDRFGWILAIIISNIIFTLYHYGAWEFTTSKVIELFFVGCFVGLLYRGTGSLIVAIVFHTIYDAVWCFTPYLGIPWHWVWGSFIQITAAALLLLWVMKLTSSNK
jgi:membrane protease YdiL (CAAX protease family)